MSKAEDRGRDYQARGSPSEDSRRALPQVQITPRDAGFICNAIDDEADGHFQGLRNKAVSAACIPQGDFVPMTVDEARFIGKAVEQKGGHNELKARVEKQVVGTAGERIQKLPAA